MTSEPLDRDYVRRLRSHDPATEEHFVAYFTPIIRGQLTPYREPLEDNIQQVFLDVLTEIYKRNSIRSVHDLRAFVERTCINYSRQWPVGQRAA